MFARSSFFRYLRGQTSHNPSTMKTFDFRPSGVCSRCIHVSISDADVVESVSFEGGCNGNLKGLARLAEGMPRAEVIRKLQGITCGMKGTSCPDQLAEALKSVEA